ncbi:FeoC-like transcriptional regulator [Vibrio sp. DW001]|uniref:FeoC-like transcriptional regulator n=1 Tax=unclassified Vibrio TaxID=2614977 RepID=UPI00189F3A99|nr:MULTISPECIES: FeoC-like transcriptional regulator [unclassified Vibrio]UGA53881.1 FeoC-like transcriptional regulator [Vibrio sp. VB16]WED25698.1 FeoC-like transcriptional regulator [Vibrio sp. DW001]
MILSDLKAYIFEQGSVTRTELAKKFALSEDGVDAMLEVWVTKGSLSRIVDLDKRDNVRQIRYRAVHSNDIQMTVIS